jgi:hypothetical protein
MAYRTATPPNELGPPVRNFAWAHTPKMVVIGVFFFLPLLAPIFLPWGDNWNFMSYLGAALMVLLMPGMGGYILLTAYRLRKNYVRVYQLGFEYRWNKMERVVLFEDVVSIKSKIEQKITNGIPGPVTHTHAITTTKGDTLPITHGFEDVVELMGEIRERSRAFILERSRETLEAGKKLTLGPVSFRKETGLQYAGKSLTRERLDRVEVRGGIISIFGEGAPAWAEIPYGEVPNAELLEPLLRMC